MAYEHEDGTASLFQNDYKENGDKRPDYTGFDAKHHLGWHMGSMHRWQSHSFTSQSRIGAG